MSPWSNGRVSFIVGVSRDCDWKMVPCAQEQLWSKRIKMQSCINPAACKAVAAPCSQFGKPIYSWSLDSSRRRCTVTSPRKPRGRPNSCGKLWKIVSSFKRMAYILEYCFYFAILFCDICSEKRSIIVVDACDSLDATRSEYRFSGIAIENSNMLQLPGIEIWNLHFHQSQTQLS